MPPSDNYGDSGSGLRTALLIAAVALSIPLFVLLILYVSGAKLAIVRNDSVETVDVVAVVHNGTAIERTTIRVIDPHQLGWIVFFPRLRGGLTISCRGSNAFATKAISSVAEGTPAYSSATFESCDRRRASTDHPERRRQTAATPLE
jgi:hypothetical protein